MSSWEMLRQLGPIWREQEKPKDTAEAEGRRIQCMALLIGPVSGHYCFLLLFFLFVFFDLFVLYFSFFISVFFFLSFFLADMQRESDVNSLWQTDKSLQWKTLRHLKAMLISSHLTPPSSSRLLTLSHWDRNTAKLKCCLVPLQATLCRYLLFSCYHHSFNCHFTWLTYGNDWIKGLGCMFKCKYVDKILFSHDSGAVLGMTVLLREVHHFGPD